MRPRILIACVALMMSRALGQAFAQAPPDEPAVRALAAQFESAWNNHDMSVLGSITTEDVDFVNVAGQHLKGREDVVKQHARLHQTMFKDSIWTTETVRVQFLRSDMALVHINWGMRGDLNPDGTPRQPRKGIFTWLVVKDGAAWKVRAAHNTNKR
jgi:uncharacterized protein (TIGR02246 family)